MALQPLSLHRRRHSTTTLHLIRSVSGSEGPDGRPSGRAGRKLDPPLGLGRSREPLSGRAIQTCRHRRRSRDFSCSYLEVPVSFCFNRPACVQSLLSESLPRGNVRIILSSRDAVAKGGSGGGVGVGTGQAGPGSETEQTEPCPLDPVPLLVRRVCELHGGVRYTSTRSR